MSVIVIKHAPTHSQSVRHEISDIDGRQIGVALNAGCGNGLMLFSTGGAYVSFDEMEELLEFLKTGCQQKLAQPKGVENVNT
jgi:hypothetical protein